MNIDIPDKLFTTFNDIVYHDEPHKYYVNNNKLTSVTTILHRYQEEFKEEYWSKYKANEYSLSQKEVLRAWKFMNKKGTMKGSVIHDYTENLFLNKVFPYPKQLILNEFGFDPVLKEYEITKKHVNNFYNDVQGKLIPIRTEMIIYDKESLIGGMLDILFYNVKTGEFQIWDWKTNKKFKKKFNDDERKRYFLNELSILEDSDLEIYSLQLAMYKLIIEKNTGLKLGKSYVVWFSHNNENYKIIETKNREYYVKMIMNDRIAELAA
ncbi:MAG: PD-(D/E)XK nuclease family protein [Bacteroidales bacterium]|jgi:hypothetical protein|nr:PD-(D/E)XK nuclease family protein [Bacteroidales bacterium]